MIEYGFIDQCRCWEIHTHYRYTNLVFMFPCIVTQYTKMTNKMQRCRIIYYSLAAVHVSSDIFARHQEHLSCITVSGITHCNKEWTCTGIILYYIISYIYHWNLYNIILVNVHSLLQCVIPEAVIQFRCSCWWAKISLETCRAAKE